MKPNQAYLLFHSKENYQKMKRQPTEWEKIFANNETDKALISKIWKQYIQLNIEKQKQPHQTIGRRPKQYIFFPKKTYKWLTGT